MLNLREFRSRAKGLPDLLTYAALIEEGIVLQKDGSLLAAWEYKGIDTSSATYEELAYTSLQVSNAIKLLGTGFMLHVDAIRTTKKAYPKKEQAFFPDPVSQLIDDERREFFGSDVCYSTMNIMALTYLPEYGIKKGKKQKSISLEKGLEYFKNAIMLFEDALSAVLRLIRLSEYELPYDKDRAFLNSDLLSYLQCCLTGTLQPIAVPDVPMYLDSLLGTEDLTGGIIPKLGTKYLSVISIDGLPHESYPVMLSALNAAPFEFRFSTRFICLDQYDAEQEIHSYVKGWNQQVLSFIDQFFNTPNAKINRDALLMREDAETAKTKVQSGIVGAGYMSTAIIMMDEDKEKIHEQAREVRRILQTLGFGCRIETINALEAWLGSLAGNGYANLRRPLVTTMNLADVLPLSTVFTGSSVCPSPFFPQNSRPLAVLTTENGSTPFWFNLHNNDLGHTLIFGPTGAGKSTLLALIAAQFPCYQHAHIYVFDKGMSMFPLCMARGGVHFAIGEGSTLAFTPLQHVDESKAELAWAEEWVLSLLELQNLTILPAHKNEIHDAMLKLCTNPKTMRSLTHFMHVVQDRQVKEAIAHYTTSGVMGHLLDAEQDTLGLSPFVVFEIEELMNMGDQNLIPVLTYIFHRIEKSLTGQPALLILDEAWVMLGHPAFRSKIREWLKVLRKANCAVVLATQSLSDAKNSDIMDVLVESCPTKIMLANANAQQEDQYLLYKDIGLNNREIAILSTEARPKRDYYIKTSEGQRLVQLALGHKTLAFVGASDKASIARIKSLHKQYGSLWHTHWLEEKLDQGK
jgi:type IV secretion system protein TrbE